MTPGPFRIGIDLGGTKTEAVVLDDRNREVYRKRVPTQGTRSYEALLSFVHRFIEEARAHAPDPKRCTIGIGIPGAIDAKTRRVQNANTTVLIGNPFQKDLEKRLGRSVCVENDANCFVLAESREGAANGYSWVFGVILGTGCGGGLCVDGKLHRGMNGIGGEWGHFSVDPSGEDCYCGNRGCIETKISGSGVERSFFTRHQLRLSMRQIVSGYRKKDPRCTEAFLRFLDDFGRCMGGLISLLDPDAVVIGGGLSLIDELYTQGLAYVKRYAFHRGIRTPILKNRLGDSAGVFGAAWLGV